MGRSVVRIFAFLASLSVLVSPSVLADPSSTATISSLSGQVQYKNPGDTDWQSASQGTLLKEGAKIFVGENSECTLTLGNNSKSVTKIKEETRAILSSLGDDLKIDLSSGEIFSLFKRSDSRSTFKISSPTAVAAVRGTAFSFAAEGIGSDMNNTVQVYEHTVALAPMDAQDKEILVNEGQGVVLGGDGVVEKQFEVSADDLRAAKEFMSEAADFLPKESIAADPVQTQEARTEEAPSDNDDKNMGAGNPPSGNPPAGPGDGPGNGPGDGPGANRFDSAMDGLMQGMAGESEMSQTNAFAPGSMTQMVSNLTDLSHGMAGVGGAALAPGSQGMPGGNFDPGAFGDAMRGALHESDYFKSQPPDVQQQLDNYIGAFVDHVANQNEMGMTPRNPMEGRGPSDQALPDRSGSYGGTYGGPMPGGSENSGSFPPGVMPMPSGGPYSPGFDPRMGIVGDPSSFLPYINEPYFNPTERIDHLDSYSLSHLNDPVYFQLYEALKSDHATRGFALGAGFEFTGTFDLSYQGLGIQTGRVVYNAVNHAEHLLGEHHLEDISVYNAANELVFSSADPDLNPETPDPPLPPIEVDVP